MKHTKYMLFCMGIISIVSSCATSTLETQTPKDRYEEYRDALPKISFEELLKKYWSSSAVAQGMPILINDSKENVLHKNAIIFSLSFPNEMQKITLIKEAIRSTNACLLVLGKSKESKLITFNIPYTLENNHWSINEVLINYLEGDQLIPTEPACNPKNF